MRQHRGWPTCHHSCLFLSVMKGATQQPPPLPCRACGSRCQAQVGSGLCVPIAFSLCPEPHIMGCHPGLWTGLGAGAVCAILL
jgi:hypothetical protein